MAHFFKKQDISSGPIYTDLWQTGCILNRDMYLDKQNARWRALPVDIANLVQQLSTKKMIPLTHLQVNTRGTVQKKIDLAGTNSPPPSCLLLLWVVHWCHFSLLILQLRKAFDIVDFSYLNVKCLSELQDHRLCFAL